MKNNKTEKIQQISAIIILLLLWLFASLAIGNDLLLPGPVTVIRKFFLLFKEADFFKVITFSFSGIALGFFSGFFSGIVFAVLAAKIKAFELLLRPVMVSVKSVPVASFIIIALVWFSSKNLSSFISFLIVLPVVYNNVFSGIKSIDKKMTEMADIYNLSFYKRLIYIWLPALKPYIISGAGTALGMSWKSGIAAEVIGIPGGSIGEKLYMSKVYFNTSELLAWTLVIVLLSVLFEKLVIALIKLFYRKLETK